MNDVLEYLVSGTFLGGILVKGFDYFLARGQRKNDAHKNMRDELEQVWARLDEQENRYTALFEEHHKSQEALDAVRRENRELKDQLDQQRKDHDKQYRELADQNAALLSRISQATMDQAEVELARRRNKELEDLRAEVVLLRAEVQDLRNQLTQYQHMETNQ